MIALRRALPACLLTVVLVQAGCVRSLSARARGWWSVSTAHIALQSDAGRERAIEMARRLEQQHLALRRVFYGCANVEDRRVTQVIALAHGDEYREIAPPRTSGFFSHAHSSLLFLPSRIVIDGSGRQYEDRQLAIFTHELTHRFVSACYPAAPTWLHEGLATYFESLEVHEESVSVGFPPFLFDPGQHGVTVTIEPTHFVVWIAPALRVAPSSLVAMTPEEFYSPPSTFLLPAAEAQTVNYASAWALTHFLLSPPEGEAQRRFDRYLAGLLDGGVEASDAFRTSFEGLDVDALVSAYVEAGHYHSYGFPWERPREIEATAESLSDPEAHLIWADLWVRSDISRDDPRLLLHLAEAEAAASARALLLPASVEDEGKCPRSPSARARPRPTTATPCAPERSPRSAARGASR